MLNQINTRLKCKLLLFFVPMTLLGQEKQSIIVSHTQNTHNQENRASLLSEKIGYIDGTEVNLRAAPNLKAQKVGQLNRPEQIEILELVITAHSKYTYWYKIKTATNKQGYVYYRYVTPDKNQLGNREQEKIADIIFLDSAIGPIKFSNHLPLSVALLKQMFPGYTINSEIGQGDSPDFYYFEISNRKGSISIYSYIEYAPSDNGVIKTPQPNNITADRIEVTTPTITDQFGLKVGDTYQDIQAKRGGQLEKGNTHHQKYIGNEGLFYTLWGDFDNKPLHDVSPEDIPYEQVIKHNWQIQSISWPRPAW